jgi:hypothetical protein
MPPGWIQNQAHDGYRMMALAPTGVSACETKFHGGNFVAVRLIFGQTREGLQLVIKSSLCNRSKAS